MDNVDSLFNSTKAGLANFGINLFLLSFKLAVYLFDNETNYMNNATKTVVDTANHTSTSPLWSANVEANTSNLAANENVEQIMLSPLKFINSMAQSVAAHFQNSACVARVMSIAAATFEAITKFFNNLVELANHCTRFTSVTPRGLSSSIATSSTISCMTTAPQKFFHKLASFSSNATNLFFTWLQNLKLAEQARFILFTIVEATKRWFSNVNSFTSRGTQYLVHRLFLPAVQRVWHSLPGWSNEDVKAAVLKVVADLTNGTQSFKVTISQSRLLRKYPGLFYAAAQNGMKATCLKFHKLISSAKRVLARNFSQEHAQNLMMGVTRLAQAVQTAVQALRQQILPALFRRFGHTRDIVVLYGCLALKHYMACAFHLKLAIDRVMGEAFLVCLLPIALCLVLCITTRVILTRSTKVTEATDDETVEQSQETKTVAQANDAVELIQESTAVAQAHDADEQDPGSGTIVQAGDAEDQVQGSTAVAQAVDAEEPRLMTNEVAQRKNVLYLRNMEVKPMLYTYRKPDKLWKKVTGLKNLVAKEQIDVEGFDEEWEDVEK